MDINEVEARYKKEGFYFVSLLFGLYNVKDYRGKIVLENYTIEDLIALSDETLKFL